VSIRAGIIGCGKIADQHAQNILSIPGCEIVGVCDTEVMMAKQLCERFGAGGYFSSVEGFLLATRPDVVHITTPAESHLLLSKQCLEAGCHIYVEKPFVLNATEAEELIAHATRNNRKVTVGHNLQFGKAAIRMRDLVMSGFLGGPPVHIESYYCYNFCDEKYAAAVLGDKTHWVRNLPGKLLQNVISHGIARIAEFLDGKDLQVISVGYTSDLLRKIGETDIVDELRVIISHGCMSAYFTFSSQMRPALHQFRLYGPRNGLLVDDDQQVLIRLGGTQYRHVMEHVVPSFLTAKEYLCNCMRNVVGILRGDLGMDAGMKVLIESFYRAIRGEGPLPIPYREIVLTSKIMDMIFNQLELAKGQAGTGENAKSHGNNLQR